MTHRTRIAAAVAAVAVLGGGATAVAATQSAAPTPHSRYEAALAKQLGVEQSKLTAAERAASSETVDALEAAGRLDDVQAKRLDAAIAKGRAPFAAQRSGRRGGVGVALLARALGAQPGDVRTQLRAGTTPADLIVKADKDPAQVRASIQAAVRAKLQERVDAGKVDAAKADARAAEVAARLTADQPLKRGGRKAAKG